jgi:hypothetical protein
MSRTHRSFFIAVIAIVAAASSFAADRSQPSYASAKKWHTAERNYIQALKTGNEGAKVSAAGFIADYRLTGAVPALIEALRSDKTETVRISAALALIMLDVKEGREAVGESALYDGSDRVAKFCESLLKAHAEKGGTIAEE